MVELAELQVTRTAVIAASPEHLYDIISDVTRIGELSPNCKEAWWDEGAGPHEGGWFTGRNEMPGRDPWERRCEVVVAEPGSAFVWIAGGREEGVVEWSYRFRPVEEGTEVEESWTILRMADGLRDLGDEFLLRMKSGTELSIEATLARLKTVAEA
jgi:hypothetical protein